MLKKKLCSFVAQLVFSSFFEDGQLGSARLAKFSARLGSARENPARAHLYYLGYYVASPNELTIFPHIFE